MSGQTTQPDRSEQVPSIPEGSPELELRRNLPALTLAAAALAVGAFIWLVLPHEREVTSLWTFLFKLVPFVLAAEAIARLDPGLIARFRRAALIVLPISFAIYFLYFVPRIFYFMDDHPNLYYHILVLTPFLILAFTLAYRLGGGGAVTARRLAYGMLLVMVSGAEDLAFLTVNDLSGTPFHPIPDVWDWASHMTVRLGHPPTKYEAYVFIAVHLVAAAMVLFAPGRWFGWLAPWRKRSGAVTRD